MRRRPVSETLVVDANIIVSAILGFRSRPLLERVSAIRALVTSTEASREVLGLLPRLDPDAPILIDIAKEILTALEVVDAARYDGNLPAARNCLRDAPASRNGSVGDAHILALAWTYDADIWSHDRDFAGAGWPSWSSANLAAALADDSAASAPPA